MCERLFERQLPGGGFVAIEVEPEKPLWGKPVFRGRVVVERRAISRRDGHEPPVISTASGPSLNDVINQLLPAAQSNATIGAALLRLHLCAGIPVGRNPEKTRIPAMTLLASAVPTRP
jgi:hypothetical protein